MQKQLIKVKILSFEYGSTRRADSNSGSEFSKKFNHNTSMYSEDANKMSSRLGSVGCEDDNMENCWHHQYYQWVGLVLLLQAGFFYVPRWVRINF